MTRDILRRAALTRRCACSVSPAARSTALLLVGLASAGCERAGGEPDAAARRPAAPVTSVAFSSAQIRHGGIRWAPVETREVTRVLEVPGRLTAHEDRTVRLGAPAEGRVLQVHVRLGDRVTRGEPLVTLQSPAAAGAQAELSKAMAELGSRQSQAAYARAANERAERLLAVKAISRQDVERARTDDELAQAALVQARAEVRRARLALAQLSVSSAAGTIVLRAPLTGVVLDRQGVPGTVVQPGALLVAVTDPSVLQLELAAPERAVSALRAGVEVRFVVPAFAADTFAARVENVGGALDPETRTLPVRAHVRNRSGRLRPEMFATVWVNGKERETAVIVPDSAVQLLDQRPVVFVAVPDGKGGARFERRAVVVGDNVGGRTQIMRGLDGGDVVVVGGAFAVKSEFARAKMAEG